MATNYPYVNSENLGTFKECLEAWVLEQLKNFDLSAYETVEAAQKAHDELVEQLETEIVKKQDALSAGYGIDITDNVVNCTLDTSLYNIVDELPDEGEDGKIYCIKDPESTDEKNIYDEWYWTGETWEMMGKYIPTVDLTPYQTKEEAAADKSELEEEIEAEQEAREKKDTELEESISALETADASKYETKSDATASHEELQDNIDKKQDKLTAGTGIDITDNVVSTTIDTNPFVFVDELPTSDIKTGKIYCTPDPESTDEKNIWDEWYWIEDEQRWEAVGKYIPKVDLDPYEKIEDAEKSHEELEDKIDKLEEDVSETYETKTDAEAAHKELQTNIDNEVKAREDADATLQTNIDKKQNKLTAGEGIEITDDTISCEVDFSEYDKTADRKALIEDSEDDTYVTKMVDADGNLLLGFKENGEIEVPTGLTDDSYNLIKALYEKLSETVNYIKALPTSGGSDLIEDGTDSQYVMKAVDSEGNLLQGIKGNGEVETPTGMTDDAYEVIVALVDKFNKLVDYVKQTL